jgi:hypothetical protein
MPKALHESDSRIIIRILKGDLVGNQLIMQTRLCKSLSSTQLLVNRMNDILDSGRDNTTASGRASNQEKLAIWSKDDRRGDG